MKYALLILISLTITACGSSGETDTTATQSPTEVSPETPSNTDSDTGNSDTDNGDTDTDNNDNTDNDGALDLPVVEQNVLSDEITAMNAITNMKIGINLGNTLDAPNEGEWAPVAQESHIEAFKQAGFKHVRVPVTWNNHVMTEAPFTIDASFLDRVEQIVDWALSRDLYVILNVHHDDWIKANYSDQQQRNRFDSIWIQVAARFKHKSARLILEILNEPHDLTYSQLNEVNNRVFSIIRNETSNRLIAFAGSGWSNVDELLSIDIPQTDDQFLIGNFHSYDPWQFAGECVSQWGTDTDKHNLKAIYQKAYDWSLVNNIPVMINEFAAAKYDFTKPENVCDQSQREAYIATHVEYADEFGFAATYWDDAGSFSTYDRGNNTWGPEKDILVSKQVPAQ